MTRRGVPLLCLALLACGQAPPPAREVSGMSAAEKERIRRFWELEREGVKAERERRCGDAVGWLEQALTLEPDHEDSLYLLAGCLADLGRFDEALARLDRLIQVSHDRSPRAHALKGELLARAEPGAPADLDAALSAVSGQLALNPEESGSMLALGELEILRGELEAADDHLDHALALNVTSARGNYARGLLRLLQGREADAAASLALAVELGRPRAAHKGVKQEGDTAAAPPPLTGPALLARTALGWLGRETREPELVELELAAPARPRALAAADFDRDGDLDLAVADELGGPRLLVNQAGKFRELAGPGGGPATGLAWGDADGDGRLDLYVSGPEGNRLHRNTGSGLGAARPVSSTPTQRALLVDVDRDGRTDLVECGGGGEPLRAYRNDGRGGFAAYAAFPTPSPARPCTSLSAADADGDGAPELLATYWKLAPRFLLNDGTGRFRDASVESGLEPAAVSSHASFLGDLDGDGRVDAVIAPWQPLESALGAGPGQPLLVYRGRPGSGFARDPAADALGRPAAMDLCRLDDGRLWIASGAARFDARLPAWLLDAGSERLVRGEWPGALERPVNSIAVAPLGRHGVALIAGGLFPAAGRRLVVVPLPSTAPPRAKKDRA